MNEFSVDSCTECSTLVENRSQIVNGSGPMDADIVLVGEAPGENEDLEGEPFIGRSGQILSELLDDAGLDRDSIRITNAVRCRPPDNRDPTDTERNNCSVHLVNELKAINPDHIIALGATAIESLTGNGDISVLKNLGEEYPTRYEDITSSVITCPHPAALIYRPSYKDDVIDLFRRLT